MIQNLEGSRLADFTRWFNQELRLQNPHLFPHPLNERNFHQVVNKLPFLSGEELTSLGKFVGYFSIIYNETGGGFGPIRELGGPAYCFNSRIQLPNGRTFNKLSYNQSPNKLAGDQLVEWGVITDEYKELWNRDVYPIDAPREVQEAAKNCDFYHKRGSGLWQITWRDAYEAHIDPILMELYGKPSDHFETDELDIILEESDFAFEIAMRSARSFVSKSAYVSSAAQKLESENFAPFGYAIAGSRAHYYVHTHYVPRCNALLKAIREELSSEQVEDTSNSTSLYAIDGLSLTNTQTQYLQLALIQFGSDEEDKLILNHGGIDGYWGDKTQECFELVGRPIKEVINVAKMLGGVFPTYGQV